MLIGQLWGNIVPYCSWVFDSKADLIELCSSEKNELEEEIDKKDKDYRLKINLNISKKGDSTFKLHESALEEFHSSYYLEITSPPPES